MNLPLVTRLGCLGLLLMATAAWAKPKQPAGSDQEPLEAKTTKVDISAGVLAGDSLATQKLERALDEPTEVEFLQAPLTDVVGFLRNRHHIEIQIDQKSLEEAGVAIDSQIDYRVKDVSLRSALELMLQNLELTFVIRNEVLLITTVSNAETIMTVRIYPIADLLRSRGTPLAGQVLAERLIDVVTGTVAPTTWNEVGGAGSIKYWPGDESLVILQTYEVHRELRDLFASLRAARAIHPADQTQPAKQAEQAAAEQAGELYMAVYRLPSQTQSMLQAQIESRVLPAETNEQPETKTACVCSKPGACAPTDKHETSAPSGGGGTMSPGRAAVDDVAQAIRNLVDPPSWKSYTQPQGPVNGWPREPGQGRIEIIGNELVILQTAKVHQAITEFLQIFAAANNEMAPPKIQSAPMMFIYGRGLF